MNPKFKLPIAALSMSAAALVGWVQHENYRGTAYIPTAGDRPTLGYGSTFHADGSPVKMGDKTDPVKALVTAHKLMTKDEKALKDSLPGVELTPGEFGLYMNWVGQFGIGNWYKPKSPRTYLLLGEHVKACDALLNWRFQAGRDCSLSANWGPQGCKGVWTRQQERHSKCMAEQGDAN